MTRSATAAREPAFVVDALSMRDGEVVALIEDLHRP
jgi:hypothetical protein